MADSTLQDMKNANSDLIRKVLDAVVLVAPMSVALPTTFTTGATSALQALPAGFRPVGWVTKDDAYTWSRDVSMSETTSHGSVEPTRRDITSDVTGLQMSAQETSRLTLELSNNVDLSDVEADAITGEITFRRPVTPSTTYWRVVAIGQDGAGDNTFYNIIVLPRAMISEYGEATWSDENELTYPLTWSATPDPELGFSYQQTLAGPGAKSRAVEMGFTVAA